MYRLRTRKPHRTPRWERQRARPVPPWVIPLDGIQPPPGVWHMEEEDAGGFVVASFVEAIHETSGERFLLAYLADKIVAVSPQSDGAHGVLPAGAHTSRWANRQRWRVGRSRGV